MSYLVPWEEIKYSIMPLATKLRDRDAVEREINAKFIKGEICGVSAFTALEFKSEEDYTLFLLRYSK